MKLFLLKPPAAEAAPLDPDKLSAMHPKVEHALALLQSTPPPGLEARVLLGLKAQARAEALAAQSRHIRPALTSTYGWAPAVAAMLCIFTGGLLVARQAGIATAAQPQITASQTAQPSAHPYVSPAPSNAPNAALATASARRKPSVQIPAGRHRGRVSTMPNLQNFR